MEPLRAWFTSQVAKHKGMFENFEITLNAVSVDIKKETTIATHHYKNDEPFENTIETEELLKLMLLWKEQITDDV